MSRAAPVVVPTGDGGAGKEFQFGIFKRAQDTQRAERRSGGAENEWLRTESVGAPDHIAQGEIVARGNDIGEDGEINQSTGNIDRQRRNIARDESCAVADGDGVVAGARALRAT